MPEIYQKRYEVPQSDVNFMHHVDNQHYLRWMMEVAFEHVEQLGWPVEKFVSLGSGFVVKSHFIEYLAPAFESDKLIKLTWISGLSDKRVTRQYQFYKLPGFQPLLRAETKWVYVDMSTGRPLDLPAEVCSAFKIATEQDVRAYLEQMKNENLTT